MDDIRRAGEHASAANGNRTGYAEWIALGAVVAGSVGAIVGARRCSHRASQDHGRMAASARPDPAMVTAPHGDKLSSVY